MTATTPVAFDPKPERLGAVRTFKAASAILMGQAVAFADAADSRTVAPATTALGTFVGFAQNSQATVGGEVSVAMDGSILTAMLDTDNGTIDAGHWVMIGAVAGTVASYDPAIGGHAATQDLQSTAPVGKALDDSIVGGSTVGSTVVIFVSSSPQKTASA
jgi:hypothetical protein